MWGERKTRLRSPVSFLLSPNLPACGLPSSAVDLPTGQVFLPFYTALSEKPAFKFSVTPEQLAPFNVFFSPVQDKYLMLQGLDYLSNFCDKGVNIREQRGNYTQRIQQLFSLFRME